MSTKKRKKRKKRRNKKPSTGSLDTRATSNTNNSSTTRSKRRRKTKQTLSKKPKDKNKPKQSPSSYLLFMNEVRDSYRRRYADKSITELAKIIATKWKSMTTKEQKAYKEKAELLRNEYKEKLAQYKECQHYKDYQQQVQEWKETQLQKEQNNESNSNHNKHKQADANLSDSSLSSNISEIDAIFAHNSNMVAMDPSDSELSEEFEDIDFVQHLHESQQSTKQSSQRQTEFNVMSIAECVLNNKHLREMPSTVKARMTQHNDSQTEEENDEEAIEAQEEEKENVLKCRMCGTQYEDEATLTQHEKKLHTKQCAQCELKFRTETELENHIFAQHDVFGTNALQNDDRIRIDEHGNFKMNRSISTQRFIYNNSRRKQRQRMRYEMTKIKNRVVLDNKTALKRKKRGRITVQSYLKTKRNNVGNNKAWSAKETRRFYQCLKYSGLNFLFMEVLYNRAIPNAAITKKEEEEKAKAKEKEGDNKDNNANDSDSETDAKEKQKKWVYRDAKALRKKYYREEKKNRDEITRIANNAKFTMEISCKIDEIVKKNKFKIKDEEYREDSDVELRKRQENKDDANTNNEEEEDVFDPLLAFKDEIEEDRREKKEMKRIKDEHLNNWRMKEEIVAQEKLRKFKQEYEEYQKIKAKGLSVEQVVNGNDGNDGNDGNEANHNNATNMEDDDDDDDNDGDNVVRFDPFATLSDHDSDVDVNGINVEKNKDTLKTINYNMHTAAVDDDDGYRFDDDYDDYQSGGMHDFDIDADPFA